MSEEEQDYVALALNAVKSFKFYYFTLAHASLFCTLTLNVDILSF